MHSLASYAVPFSYVSRRDPGVGDVLSASSVLLWVDHPFVITAAQPVMEYRERMAREPNGCVWLGRLRLEDLAQRLVCLSELHNLATLRVSPDELDELGPTAAFYNPLRWPPRVVEAGETIEVLGYPRDQWPAPLTYTFRAEAGDGRRFAAQLTNADMPGHLEGLCGAPAFRRGTGREPELVGVVVESMLHNEEIIVHLAGELDHCGRLSDA
jgi:hypothetical protein